jgi:predicted thioesterase
MAQLEPGLKGTAQIVVSEADLASSFGNPDATVMSSMTLMTLMEQAAIEALAGRLAPGEMTVGVGMELRHLAPTPPGFQVRAVAELVEVDGRRLTFQVTVEDEVEKVGEGRHLRVVVDRERFLRQVAEKRAAKEG